MNPYEAYFYAEENGPSEKIREIACEDSYFAYLYALDIDKEPRDNTRKAACAWVGDTYEFILDSVYLYAKDVDKGFHEVTWNTVKNTEYEQKYIEILNSLDKKQII